MLDVASLARSVLECGGAPALCGGRSGSGVSSPKAARQRTQSKSFARSETRRGAGGGGWEGGLSGKLGQPWWDSDVAIKSAQEVARFGILF